MIEQTLFDLSPVVHVPDTRELAFQKAQAKAPALRIRLVKAFAQDEFTPDEYAQKHGLSVLSVRPRCAELHKWGLLWHHGYGRSIEGNKMNKYTLYPKWQKRLEVLSAHFPEDQAASQLIEEVKAIKD